MPDNRVEIKFGGDATELKAALQDAGAVVSQSLQKVGDQVSELAQVGQQSNDKIVQSTRQLEDRKYEIEQAAIYRRIDLLREAGELTKAEETKLYAQIEAIQDKQVLSRLQTLNKMKSQEINTWKSISRQISSTMTNAITAMLTGTQSLANSLKSLWNQIAAHIIGKIIQITVEFVGNEIRKTLFATTQEGARTGAAAAGAIARDGIQDASAASGLSKQAAAGMKAIFNDAKIAASGAYQSASQIPYVGWILGPVAAAAAFAAVMAFGTLTSAAGGWSEVPSDQLAMVHKSEMVLPAHLAQAIRDMANPAAAIAQAVNLAMSTALGSTSPLASASTILRSGLAASLAPALSIAANGPAMALSGIGSYGIPADKLTFTRAVLSGGLSFGSAGAGTASASRRGAGGDVTVSNPTFNFPSNLADLVKGNPNALYRGIRDGVKKGHISKRNLRR